MFMPTSEVKKCLESIKIKNTEGYDRIPQRVLADGIQHLLPPFTKLFDLIYKEKTIPEHYKLMDSSSHTCEWVHLNFNQILTSRQTTFVANKSNRKRVGLNAIANIIYILNGRIPLSWFNMSIDTYKVH